MEKTITNEQVIAKVEKIMKQIDPNSKKQITELSENAHDDHCARTSLRDTGHSFRQRPCSRAGP